MRHIYVVQMKTQGNYNIILGVHFVQNLAILGLHILIFQFFAVHACIILILYKCNQPCMHDLKMMYVRIRTCMIMISFIVYIRNYWPQGGHASISKWTKFSYLTYWLAANWKFHFYIRVFTPDYRYGLDSIIVPYFKYILIEHISPHSSSPFLVYYGTLQ